MTRLFTIIQNTPVTSAVQASAFRYSVKIINSKKKSDYMVLGVGFRGRFADPEAIKAKLHEAHPEKITSNTKEVGYIQSGHGCRGKQRWIVSEEDIEEMYKDYNGKGEILLWCYTNNKEAENADIATPPSKHPRSASKPTPKTSTESVAQKLTEVDEIVSELKDHSSDYSPEQIRAWAHLIHMNKHDSYLVPPNKPFFRKRKSAATVSSTHSPGKKIGLRSECINQLKKWHELLECGGITKTQYDELQKTILGDINQL